MSAKSNDSLQPLDTPEIMESREKLHDLPLVEVINYLKAQKNFYASYLASFEKIEDPDTPTMSVSIVKGRYVLRYHPEWYKYLKKEEVSTVLEHECLHIMCNHIPRYAMIEDALLDEQEKMKARMVFNAAADLAVNSLIEHYEYSSMPKNILLPRYYGLEDLKSMEHYAEELMKRVKIIDVEVEIEMDGTDGGSGGGKSGESSAQGQDPQGSGEGNGTKTIIKVKRPKLTTGDKDLDDLMDKKHNWDVKDKDSTQSTRDICTQLESEAEKVLKDTYTEIGKSTGGKGCGSLPGSFYEKFDDSIQAVNTSTWKRLMHRFVRETKAHNEEFRINKPKRNRWSMDSDIGLYGSDVENPKFKIDVGIDTSGSMASSTLEEILSFIQSMLQMDDELEVRVTEYDTHVHRQYTLPKFGTVDTQLCGRGGTDFNAFFKAICESQESNEKDAFKSDIVFNFTDGEAYAPREDYRFNSKKTPVVWVLMQGGVSPCPEYGHAISM